jgi:S1-C subfamily serine protease
MLLKADSNGYLFATARHVVDGLGWRSGKGIGRVLLSSSVGGWATAQVVGRHKDLDVALLWVPRRSGRGDFYQPIVSSADTHAGEQIYVIGHPEGLNFSIASGLVSRVMPQALQLSAPVSPGNSGGPVYDERGRLLGVVSSKVDRSVDPNAENLSFAVRAVVFASADGWEFEDQGKLQLLDYETKIKMEQTPPGPARNN